MTRVAVLLDVTRIRVLPPAASGAGATPLLEVPWTPSQPDDAIRRLRDALGGPSSVVLVVGLGWLEIARPELPPLPPPARRALLMRDADRYFPIAEPAAVAWSDGLAFAMPAATVAGWRRAFEAWTTVEAIVTLPWACAQWSVEHAAARDERAGLQVDGGAHDLGVIVVRDGVVRDARRVSGTSAANASALDVAAVLRVASRDGELAVDEQLLDAESAARMVGRRRTRLLRSSALLVAALVALAWSADRWRARTYEAWRVESVRLAREAEPARAALVRLERASAEAALLSGVDRASQSATRPAAVLARLGAVLPRDAFIQRLDWDGTAWRIDGSAIEGARIVPLLDADPAFADVRIVAASTRFADGGRQRESFSIAFTTTDTAAAAATARNAAASTGGARGTR